MQRRDFLKTGIQTAAVGAAGSIPAYASPAATATASPAKASAVMSSYSAEDHRRRLQNIGLATREIRTCLRKHLVTNYLPGQCQSGRVPLPPTLGSRGI